MQPNVSSSLPVPAGAVTLTADCSADVVGMLLAYDHHCVTVDDRFGVLITYPVMALPVEDHNAVWVVKHPSAESHPRAPDHVQHEIDRLSFIATSHETLTVGLDQP